MFRSLCLSFLAMMVVLLPAQANATSVLQMNLEELCAGATQIIRGTVQTVSEVTVEHGGGELPAIEYTVAVEETLKGEPSTLKGVPAVQFKVLGTLKHHASGQSPIVGLPQLQVGGDYLLMIAASGPAGLTAPMGLGQGCFTISGKTGSEVALNEADNRGLFTGMDAPSMPSSGPVAYSALVDQINDVVGGN